MLTERARIAGGVLGMLVGDALGVPYVFHGAEDIPARALIEFAPPAGFRRAHARVAPGTWSDDGAQALCLLASLLEKNRFDAVDFGERLVAWFRDGYMAVDSHVFDIGVQTQRALRALESGVPAAEAGPREERDNGNGSLMRVLPLALWHTGSDADLVRDAYAQSEVTHGHARSRVCCGMYSLWARRMLAGMGHEDAWTDATKTMRALLVARVASAESEALEQHVRPDETPNGKGSGYVVDALASARMVVTSGTYEDVVRAAVALGDDTDTTACIAGGIAGIRDGHDAIPVRWRDALRGMDIVAPLLARLLARPRTESAWQGRARL